MNADDRQKIINSFLKKGYQLDESILGFLQENTSKTDGFITYLQKTFPNTPTVTKTHLSKFLKENESSLKILKTPQPATKPYTKESVLNYLQIRYDFIKNTLQKKMGLTGITSINKIGRSRQFSLIGLLREIYHDKRQLTVEDKTGTTRLDIDETVDTTSLVNDEVVGLICTQEEDKAKIKNIVYPDVEIKRTIPTTKETNCVFLSDFHLGTLGKESYYENYKKWCDNLDENTIVFVLGGISTGEKHEEFLERLPEQCIKVLLKNVSVQEKENYILLDDPTTIDIGGITILITYGNYLDNYMNQFKSDIGETIVNLIKKRHLNPTYNPNGAIYQNDPYLLDITPDIIAIGSTGKPKAMNYKGITIISTGSFLTEPIYWNVDLSTRETLKVDFT